MKKIKDLINSASKFVDYTSNLPRLIYVIMIIINIILILNTLF